MADKPTDQPPPYQEHPPTSQEQPPPPQEPAVETAPDPDEDDLDDLDDVLDQFNATNIESKGAAPSSSLGPGRPSTSSTLPKAPAFPSEDEFAKQLQAGMSDLLSELDQSPDMQKQFEEFMKELGGAATGVPDAAAASAAASAIAGSEATSSAGPSTQAKKEATSADAAKAEANFQDTIRRTIERMQESGDQASAAAATSSEDDLLAQMLKEMEKGGFGDGEGNDEDFSKMLMGMMEQLTNKDILYEPMKELNDKFPDWFQKNKDKVDKADLARYEEQRQLVKEITTKFEEKDYADTSAPHREYIVERMQKMQAAGAPPPDLVGDMNAAQEALGEIDQGCPTQ